MHPRARSVKRQPTFSAALLAAAGACAASQEADLDAGWSAHVVNHSIQVRFSNRVDVLFVVDGSPAMAQERAHLLEEQLPRALRLLLRDDVPGLEGAMGPHLSLRFGVVSADLGACAAGHTALHFTERARPPSGITLHFECAHVEPRPPRSP